MLSDYQREAGATEYDTDLQIIDKVAQHQANLSRDRHEKFMDGINDIHNRFNQPSSYVEFNPEPFDTIKGIVGYGSFVVLIAILYGWSSHSSLFYSLKWYSLYATFITIPVTAKAIIKNNSNLKKILKICGGMLLCSFVLYADAHYFYRLIRPTGTPIMIVWASFVPALYYFAKAYNAGRVKN